MGQLVLVIHNVRSAMNVGSMLRTAEGFGVDCVYMTGYTPYPESKDDKRLPHQRKRIAAQIHKTALGAEDYLEWKHQADIGKCLGMLAKKGFLLVALEQTTDAIEIGKFKESGDIALIVGNELTGIEKSVLSQADKTIKIPMSGHKESFNVSIAAAIALYELR